VENLADLLADAAPVMEAVPLQPSTPTMDVVEVEVSGSLEPVVTPRLSQEEAKEPTATIRLVGGGGSSGVIDATPTDDAIPELATDIMPVTSSGSSDSPSQQDKKHEKNKSSIVSLKKIANIGGGKRKKDSNSSTKETI